MNDSNAAKATLTTSTLGGASKLNITGNSVDTITVDNNISSVNTGAGNDAITLDSTKKITTTVDGGAGTDAVILSGNADASGVTLKNVEILAGTGTVSKEALTSVKQLGTEDTDTYGTGVDTADITVTKLGTSGINLSNLKAGENVTTAKISLQDVKGGTITLSKDGDSNISETIVLTEKATKVKISNFDVNGTDKLNVMDTGGFASNNSALSASNIISNGSNSEGKLYFLKLNKDITALKLSDIFTSSAAKVGSSEGKKAIIAITNDDDGKDLTAFYLVTAGASGQLVDTNLNGISGAKLTLLGTVDKDAAAASLGINAAGDITLA